MSFVIDTICIKIKNCPSCDSNRVIPIIYGKLTLDDLEMAERGQLKFGGNKFNDFSPRYYCVQCKLKFLTNYELNKI